MTEAQATMIRKIQIRVRERNVDWTWREVESLLDVISQLKAEVLVLGSKAQEACDLIDHAITLGHLGDGSTKAWARDVLRRLDGGLSERRDHGND